MGALVRERGDGSMVTGTWGRERGDGTMGTVPWELHHLNGINFFIICFKKNLHCMIEMIYFHGSIGKGEEGQHFFYICFKKYFLPDDSNDLF